MVIPTMLDDKLCGLLSAAVKSGGGDFLEIRAEENIGTRIVFKGKDPEVIAEPQSLGFFVRVLKNGSWGIAIFTDIKKLKEKIAEALEFAKGQGKGKVSLSAVSPVQAKIEAVLKKDFRLIPLKKKVSLAKHYNSLLLAGAPIQSTTLSYQDSFLTKFYVNSSGSRILEQRPYVRLAPQAIARRQDVVESYRGSFGHVGGFEVVENLDKEMTKISKEAVELSGAPKVKSGVYTVILDPLMAGTFAHEAFGHLSEADHQYENPKILEQMEIGRQIGSSVVSIVDDPSIAGGWGNYGYDDEGVLGKRVNLMTAGIITGRLHSRETAAKLGEQPNGHARADGFSHKPIVRMSNTFFIPGKENLKNLISSTKRGIMVVNWLGGMTAMESFTFTALFGVMIENGQLAQKVRGVKLTGNVFETLKNIDGVSQDFAHDQGTCGKEGQQMPVGSGGAYIRIHNVTVGGA